ncbi:hypothetical protein AB0M02_13315 [Actinoplanes sp. NPDC051861]|uniref:hypothetical protein n=1 Tax=Actinoplanes sp. NPDC051861 TaxID=3155170 RepID=UPI00343D3CEE
MTGRPPRSAQHSAAPAPRSPTRCSVALRLAGRMLRFPAYCAAALRAALDGAPHPVADLPLDDDEDRLVPARRLLTEGLVVPAPSGLP